jgi:hypothetical protein
MLPQSLKPPLRDHLKKVKAVHDEDLAAGWGRVHLPAALERKYRRRRVALAMGLSAFPQENRWINPRTKEQGRHHINESLVQEA